MIDDQLVKKVKNFYEMYHLSRVRIPDQWMKMNYWAAFLGSTLEVGGGTLFPIRGKYVLVDLSFVAAKRANTTGVPALVADGMELSFPDDSFDTVACYDVLEHVVNPKDFLSEMCRVARKRVVIAGPNYIGEHPGGLSRYLPIRLLAFLVGPGRSYRLAHDPYLTFDEEWFPDRDAVCMVNVGYVASQLRLNGFRIRHLRSWEHAYHSLNIIPGIRCLGQYMFVVGDKV